MLLEILGSLKNGQLNEETCETILFQIIDLKKLKLTFLRVKHKNDEVTRRALSTVPSDQLCRAWQVVRIIKGVIT